MLHFQVEKWAKLLHDIAHTFKIIAIIECITLSHLLGTTQRFHVSSVISDVLHNFRDVRDPHEDTF